ncbi:MAG: hypothetical protein WCH85_08090, partial [Methanomicrobiales archaeon]
MITDLHGEHVSGTSIDRIPDEQRSDLASRTLRLSMLVTVLIGFAEFIFWMYSRNNLFLIHCRQVNFENIDIHQILV